MPQLVGTDLFESIVSNIPEAIIFLDAEDRICHCNPAAEKIRRINSSKVIGRTIYDIHPPVMHDRIRELLASLKSGVVATNSRVIQAQSRYFDNSYSAIRDQDGHYQGTLLISRDITEQQLANKSREPSTNLESQPIMIHSEAMKRVVEMAKAIAALDSTVLLEGENGTGKECIVELIHQHSPRHLQPLIKINCAAMPENLIESELYGHVRGAFTGAIGERKGKFELANRGTLLLDEIGEMPLLTQAKLLRAIQGKSIQRVGGQDEIEVDVRIIAATNRNLVDEVAAGRFREDLYYRLNVISLKVPPLRERREDIIPLAELFIKQSCLKAGSPLKELSTDASAKLLSHPLPGNVRQLKHAMERAVVLGPGNLILPQDLPEELTRNSEPATSQFFSPEQTLKQAIEHFETDYLRQALQHHRQHKTLTAQTLGITRKSLWQKLQKNAIASEVTDS